MNKNRLMLNDNKTEVLMSGRAGSLRKLERSTIHTGDSEINFSTNVERHRYSLRSGLVKFKR